MATTTVMMKIMTLLLSWAGLGWGMNSLARQAVNSSDNGDGNENNVSLHHIQMLIVAVTVVMTVTTNFRWLLSNLPSSKFVISSALMEEVRTVAKLEVAVIIAHVTTSIM